MPGSHTPFRLITSCALVLGVATASQGAVLLDDFRDQIDGPIAIGQQSFDRRSLTVPGVFNGIGRTVNRTQFPETGNSINTTPSGLAIISDLRTVTVSGADLVYDFSPLGEVDLEQIGHSLQLDFTIDSPGIRQGPEEDWVHAVLVEVSSGNPYVRLFSEETIVISFEEYRRETQDPFDRTTSLRIAWGGRAGFEGTLHSISIIPEPTAALLAGLALGLLALNRHRIQI